MSGAEDEPRAVRKGEELDLESLRPRLERDLGRSIDRLEVEQFPGGHSNLTYLLRIDGDEYVLRRPPFGSQVKRAHDMGREHRILSALSDHVAWAPEPVAFCEDESVIGAEFYLMERIRGVILRRAVPEGVTIDEDQARHLSETLLSTLVELHGIAPEAVGLGDLGKPEGYVERQVRGWNRRYEDAATDDIVAMPRVGKWLVDHMPASGPGVVIHNDYKFDNVIYDSERLARIVGVLDWEMATRGDALMDLGSTLSYWVQADDPPAIRSLGFGPTTLPGMFTRRELAERYGEATGRDVSQANYYFVFGLFKTAVVLQQIYYRYHHGKTQDERFAGLIHAVRAIAELADASIERGRL